MQSYNRIGLRESLEQLETAALDDLLQAELAKESPDPDSVRLIVRVLEERDTAAPAPVTAGEEAAWHRYLERMAGFRRKPVSARRWLATAASVVLVLGLLFTVVPQQAEAETFWEMLQRWTATVLSYIDRDETLAKVDYLFETENPGLQQVYDAVVELGVTDPVVPMWLPSGYELTDQSVIDTPMLKGYFAYFSGDEHEIVYKLDIYQGEPAHQFYKDGSYYEEYEKNGMNFYITQNNGSWVAVWTKENIECSISIVCQEDTLRRILGSIYVMEES